MKHKFTKFTFIVFLIISFVSGSIYCQEDSIGLNKKRLKTVVIGAGALYVTSMAGLYQLWYKDYPQSSFHFFNDNNEWLQMDKIGHFTTAYYLSNSGYETLRYCGLGSNKSMWYASGASFLFLTTIEVFDGFSEEWGASSMDFLVNTAGIILFSAQQYHWKEQKIKMKFSFHQTTNSDYRPDLLGNNFIENVIKDYNGQSYWLSANIKSFIPKHSQIPEWLNIAFGYSAKGMIGAIDNYSEDLPADISDITRCRQYFMSFDIDLSKIKTNSQLMRMILKAANFIKIPFPALEYNIEDGIMFHTFYF
ncbi:DUF2279 domain-containing protein [Bacteroidota bacterium]